MEVGNSNENDRCVPVNENVTYHGARKESESKLKNESKKSAEKENMGKTPREKSSGDIFFISPGMRARPTSNLTRLLNVHALK